ncbi:bifunctional homocysteine S-methyltransferase/methylenetetrahydrofolate reductase [Alicyclobacillus pomorum]|uniref:bifunctional homocysteine S-methyltransferase/methylenetetrahydrofolate reductase n=1 Tax=Alicyclobacillus pomorum TaxID=204470 RepID=UPI000421370E|nr:bifunctional homocysteine S-methyltransferase/methylenetetrahydrofolate reductase [Alicyclobacillus pomorum]
MTRTATLKERLANGWIVGDGAMATLLHQIGVPARTCFEGLCLSQPEMVRDVHRAYVAAGAELIQTNTFSGHRVGLARYGITAHLKELNQTAVRLAREAVGESGAFVLGTVGSTSDLGAGDREQPASNASLSDIFEEQMTALLEASVDGLLLETFSDLEEMMIALETARRLTSLPIIANLAPDVVGVTRDGYSVVDAFATMRLAGADVVGLNCRLGLSGILRTYEKFTLNSDFIYAAYPNAGMLHYSDGDYSYTADAEYFAEVGGQLAARGIRVLGGCCGTTPDHIRRLKQRMESGHVESVLDQSGSGKGSLSASTKTIATVEVQPVTKVQDAAHGQRPSEPSTFSLLESVRQRMSIVVELDPPKTLDVTKYLAGAAALREAGADAVTLADNSLGTVRVSNMALASMLKQNGIEPLVHVTCRDRNLIGQQSHLMGLHVLGIHHVLLVTGDPSRFGDLPGATSVYDVSSIELTKMVKRLNAGIGFSGQPMKYPSRFIIGTAFNPHVRHFDKALERLRRKLDAGADYVMTQPIFDIRLFEPIARAAEEYGAPVFVGIMPLVSARNARFLHHEVPGITIPESILRQMLEADPESAADVGLDIAKTLLNEARNYFNGIYLITPFLRYDLTTELTRHLREQQGVATPQRATV